MPRLTSSSLADRDQLIEQHRSYVNALAVEIMHTLGRPVDLNELIAYGQVGLIEAAERFDPLRGVTFSTFSYYRIKGAIYDGLRAMGHISRAAGRARQRFQANANELLQAAADDEQSRAEASASLDDEIAETQSLIDTLIPVYLLSLESDKVPDVVDRDAVDAAQIEERELIEIALQAVGELSPDEQQLIEALYFKHVSMTLLAEQMGVTKSWISRLHAKAVRRLRDLLMARGVLAPDS